MAPRRPQPTAASKARADRIAAALAGMLEEAPPPTEWSGDDPYRAVELPPKPAASAAALRCPSCSSAMEIVDERGVQIHRCTACAGLWLDPGELDQLVAAPQSSLDLGTLREEMRRVAPPIEGEDEIRYRMCPRCREPMNRRNYGTMSGVVIDECVRHGMYLDAREFDAIETFIRMGGHDLQREHLAERARERHNEQRATAAASMYNTQTPYAYHWRFLLHDIFSLF